MSCSLWTNRRFALAVAPLLLASQTAWSAGFALLEQSSSQLGTAFSGTAAAADDATTLFFNPAGMLHVDGTQMVVSLSDVYIDSEFSNANSQAALGQSLGNEGGNAGGPNYVPSAYFTTRFSDRFAAGIGVNAPFGLKLEYDSGWMGRFQALLSEIKTININPAVAMRVGSRVTLGAGLDYQYLDAELTSAVNYTAVIASQAPGATPNNLGLQGTTSVAGDDWAFGFNVGALFDLSDDARIGVHYRSSIKYTVEGDVTFAPPAATDATGIFVINSASAPGGALSNGPVSVKLEVPASATLSYWQRVGSNVTLTADVAWTQWSSIPELRVVRASGAVLSVTPENWDDTWRAAIGASFRLNDTWTLRAGVAHDQTPVPDSTRTPRLPDGDRNWIALGAGWSPGDSWSVDFGYAHLFVKDAPINQNAGNTAAYGLINGEQNTAIDILTAQVGYKFGGR
jgi:long-chain fatty acid transport protein